MRSSPDAVTAAWVLPIVGQALRDATVTVEQGRIARIEPSGGRGRSEDLGHVVVLPALVNAHTHVELSHLHGRVPPGRSFVDWVRVQLALRRQTPDPQEVIERSALDAATRARTCGTGLIGDISNTGLGRQVLRRADVPGVAFHELIGFRAADAPARLASAPAWAGWPDAPWRDAVAPHAPYSVSPPLFEGIDRGCRLAPNGRTTVHLAESPEEVQFLHDGTGPWRSLIEELGAWDPEWSPPGVSPVAYLARLRVLHDRVLVVHGVQCDAVDRDLLRASGATVAVCARSNEAVGVGTPPVQAFHDAGIPVAIGTDSLASAPDLDLFAELAAVRRLAPGIAPGRLLESATRVGADALGFPDRGRLVAGAAASVIAVALPDGIGRRSADDVEEYLVSGVPPDRVRWVWPPSAAPRP